ncbi:MAG: biotin/lipoyl-binding protein, partial [Alphaproteobacteria bacterium]
MDRKNFSSIQQIQVPKPIKTLQKIMLIGLIIIILILSFTPWRQTARGFGHVISLDPNNRAQNIHATVNGRIKEWFVRDGSRVKAGDKLVEIIDNDPLIIERLQAEKS